RFVAFGTDIADRTAGRPVATRLRLRSAGNGRVDETRLSGIGAARPRRYARETGSRAGTTAARCFPGDVLVSAATLPGADAALGPRPALSPPGVHRDRRRLDRRQCRDHPAL